MKFPIEEIKIGHWTDTEAETGCTVIRFPKSVVASGEVRGGAPATREFELLAPERTVENIDAVVISGGSAFGLSSAIGVVEFLEESGIGFPTAQGAVPIVVGMSLYDLGVGSSSIRPGAHEGRIACLDGENTEIETGRIGAGAGATTGNWRGKENLSYGGIGIASAEVEGVIVCSLFAVNPAGDVIDEKIAESFIKESFELSKERENIETTELMNTTLGVVMTNLSLTKSECYLLSQSSHDGIARSIFPAHTRMDGDAVVAVSTKELDGDSRKFDIARTLSVFVTEKAIRQACV
ncbi:MAG: peptidase S58 DmpA [Actinobacteria bacterium]|nr:peptidase S58 DmpA [Actinomycetota bacterium]MCH2407724.1 P1 family peptidase [Acidimicrobiales bacterium]|tara:strand:- start:5910 stop:6791 length:882 start_codon:yes stop_codon:yes gene_type:complete